MVRCEDFGTYGACECSACIAYATSVHVDALAEDALRATANAEDAFHRSRIALHADALAEDAARERAAEITLAHIDALRDNRLLDALAADLLAACDDVRIAREHGVSQRGWNVLLDAVLLANRAHAELRAELNGKYDITRSAV